MYQVVRNRDLMGDSVPDLAEPVTLVEWQPPGYEPGHLETVLRVWELGADEYLRRFPLAIPE